MHFSLAILSASFLQTHPSWPWRHFYGDSATVSPTVLSGKPLFV